MGGTHFTGRLYQLGGVPVPLDANIPFGPNSRVFFVDTANGSDGNDGLTPEHAKATITNAIAQCTASRRDVVYVLKWSTDNGETWPIPMSVAGVTLLGMQAGGPHMNSMAYITSVGNYGAITISANYCRVQHLYLACASDSYDAIGFSGTPGGTGIIECLFGTCKDAVGGGAGATYNIGWTSEISGNIFTQQVADHGIYVYNPANILIANNMFSRVQGDAALEINGGAGYPRVLYNYFSLKSDLAGGAITCGATNYGGLFVGNQANYGNSAMSNNPYLDPGTTYKNDWMLNYYGITASQPATS